MKSSKASIDKIIDGLITSTNDCFYQLLCATTLYQLGQLNVDQLDNNVKVSVEVGLNLQIEPIPIRDIRSFRSSYPSFLLIFHKVMDTQNQKERVDMWRQAFSSRCELPTLPRAIRRFSLSSSMSFGVAFAMSRLL